MHLRAGMNAILLVLVLGLMPLVKCFHLPNNMLYDCWDLKAGLDGNSQGTVMCEGLEMEWVIEPPSEIELGREYPLAYRVRAEHRFYRHMLAFQNYNNSVQERMEFCFQNATCPADVDDATKDNCCIWHANIHTCHPRVVSDARVCGPWVGNDGELSTHTSSQIGSINKTFYDTLSVNFEGTNTLIAHIKIANIQIALGKELRVVPQKVCGDGICSDEIGESCDTCEKDCCSDNFPVSAIIAIVVSVITFCILVPVVVFIIALAWYYYQRRKLFFDESWIIQYEDIQRDTDYRGFMGSLMSLRNFKFLNPEVASDRKSSIGPLKKQQMFAQTGIYDGKAVAIKRMPRRDLVVTNAIRREVMQIRILDHPNLCKFIGATVKDPLNLCIISEYCPKGSLNDVLQNDDIPLNWGFRFSFANDVACGMAYLHSKRLYHGRLTSSNCVIDDRWVCKIADFGLPSFRTQDGRMSSSDCSVTEARTSSVLQVYMPPEVRNHQGVGPSPTTDVYSYAIILLEVATRMDTFSDEVQREGWKPKVTLSDLHDNECPCPREYMELIHRCWSFLPTSRPTFDQIKKNLYRINPNRESPVDNMMILMEKYSKHLEVLVAERTQELIAEQKKTATLLYSMLPRLVADDLKHGKPSPAETFQCATIFFSDIVGFTTLASTSTPLEVVTLLNELYSMFDDILDRFDVYKVETIGDAYVVVSGVPKRNGDSHAGEIASMALQLVEACRKFKIPHRPETRLEIRVGIHSGPVCAGVVGMKMPRYCLFGDTVNTTSRMESTSEAMRIHCSDNCCRLLQELGGFRLEYRGPIEVKGKGTMTTWWLLGMDEDKNRRATPPRPSPKPIESVPRITIGEIVQDMPGLAPPKRATSSRSMSRSYREQEVLPGFIDVSDDH